jgi:hypothetical protein
MIPRLKDGEELCNYCSPGEKCYKNMWSKHPEFKTKKLEIIRCPYFIRRKK